MHLCANLRKLRDQRGIKDITYVLYAPLVLEYGGHNRTPFKVNRATLK